MRTRPLYLAILITALAAPRLATADTCGCQDFSSSACCGGPSGFVGGIELTMFDVWGQHGAGTDGGVIDNDYFQGFDMIGDARFWFGYEAANGMGLRFRWWEYEQTGMLRGARPDRIDIELYDIEATGDFCVGAWDFTLLGGVRWGQVGFVGNAFGVGTRGNSFNGAGVLIGLQARRPIWGGLGLVGSARTSVLYGDSDVFAGGFNGFGFNTQQDKNFLQISEYQLGVEYARTTGWGNRVFVRGMWEQQIYDGLSTYNAVIDPEDVAFSLAGPVFSIGVDY